MLNRKVQLIIGIVLTLAASGCQRQDVKAIPIKPVAVMTIRTGEYATAISSSGNVKPSKTVNMAFKVSGTIQKISVNEGSCVKKGQILAELDTEQYELNALAAESNYDSLKLKVESEIPSAINQAKSQLELVTSRHERYQKLYENGNLPKDKFDAIEAELTVIKNKYQEALNAQAVYDKQLEQAKAMSDLARTKLADTRIDSPIDGVVVKKMAESGELAAAGYPVMILGRLDEVEVEIGVADQSINRLSIGQKADVYVYGLDREFSGTITEIGAMADLKTRTFGVKITVNNEANQLKPGMVAKVTIPLDIASGVLIPVDSVINTPEGPMVFVYSPKTGVVTQKKVATGQLRQSSVEILQGLHEGEQLVISGQFKIKDGDSVNVEVQP